VCGGAVPSRWCKKDVNRLRLTISLCPPMAQTGLIRLTLSFVRLVDRPHAEVFATHPSCAIQVKMSGHPSAHPSSGSISLPARPGTTPVSQRSGAWKWHSVNMSRMQARLAKAARLVTADINTTTSLRRIVTVGRDVYDPDVYQYRYGPEDGRVGHSLGPIAATTVSEAAVKLADNAQDDVIEALWEPWPKCPGHGHPAKPIVRSRQAVWVCRMSGDQIAEIGHLPHL